MEVKGKHFTKKTLEFVFLNTTLLVIFLGISSVEFFLLPEKSVIVLGAKFLNDVISVLLITVILSPLFALTSFIKKGITRPIFVFIYVILVLVQGALAKYSSTTFVNLGADILGYSFDDLYMTVNASNAFSVINILFIVSTPLLFIVLFRIVKKIHLKLLHIYTFIIIGVLGLVCKWTLVDFFKSKNENKLFYLVSDIIKFNQQNRNINAYDITKNSEYPFLRSSNTKMDVLSPFFNLQKEKPNIVLLVIEGLGSEFVGDYNYAGCTPYLDSMIPNSLYWKNFISNTGRSFGLLPSLTGSLPYGDKGFLEIKETPSHLSLFTLLKENGYTTSFYAGHNSSFDKKSNFLEYNGIDYILDENNFGLNYEKAKVDAKGFTWGYPDDQIFKKTLSILDEKERPRFDVVLTLTNHEPFEFPEKDLYLAKVDSILDTPNAAVKNKTVIKQYPDIFASLLYVDNSIKNFIEGYKKRPDYKNTIFIITGDHRLIPVQQKDQLCIYHVPMLMYSPMLKKPAEFASISSHWDLAPSLLALLKNKYAISLPEKVAWMGQGIDTSKNFRNTHQIPLMRYKGKLSDFIFEEYLFSEDELFKITKNFGTYKVTEPEKQKVVEKAFTEFKSKNSYVTSQDKLYPKELNVYIKKPITFSDAETQQILRLTKGLTYDEIFRVAQQKAFSKEYITAQLLCTYTLEKVPNHLDVRLLYGRVLAWQKNYEIAESEFLNVLVRAPYYDAVYAALFDLYWWSGQEASKSIPLAAKAIKNGIKSETILFKIAKAYQRVGNVKEAQKLMDQLLKMSPTNQEYITFKKATL